MLELGTGGFPREEKPRVYKEKFLRAKYDDNQQQTQPTDDAESGNRIQVTSVGGKSFALLTQVLNSLMKIMLECLNFSSV